MEYLKWRIAYAIMPIGKNEMNVHLGKTKPPGWHPRGFLHGYRLYNLYLYDDGKAKTPHCLACTVVQGLGEAEGYVFQNIKNVTVDQGLPGNKAGMPSSVNGNAYTIAQPYRTVKKINRFDGGLKYTAEERDKYAFAFMDIRPAKREVHPFGCTFFIFKKGTGCAASREKMTSPLLASEPIQNEGI